MIPTPPEEAPSTPFTTMVMYTFAVGFVVVALMIALIVWINEPYAERMDKQLADWSREQTRLRERCESAGGQYVQYRGDLLCMDLLFNPNAKEIRP